MLEIYIIYNKETGFIESAGRINRMLDALGLDGSTATERIQKFLANDLKKAVIYLPNQPLPNYEEYKIDKGKVVLLAVNEAIRVKQPRIDEEKIEAEVEAIIREAAIQSLKDKGELPPEYADLRRR